MFNIDMKVLEVHVPIVLVLYDLHVYFYSPVSNDRGHIFLSCLSVCLSVVNSNLCYNF